jgi:hypothetical protein
MPAGEQFRSSVIHPQGGTMSRKDYVMLAQVMGDALAITYLAGGESARTEHYNECYLPLALALKAANPAFDELRFSAATNKAEVKHLVAARKCGRKTPA